VSRDGVAGLVCLAGSLVLLWVSRALPQPALVPIGPAFYPRVLLVVTAGLSLALVADDLRRRHRRRPAPPPVNYRLVLTTFAIFIAYVALLPLLGYRIATFLFVAGLQASLHPPRGRRWLLPVSSGLATTIVTYYVFERYLSVLLPRGTWTAF
jgi:hypothetical protein